MPAARKLFIAGATGVVGREVVRQADTAGVEIVPLVRPKSAHGALHPRAKVADLGDAAALQAAMAGCTTVLQLIGTMRSRFSAGDTYEASDIGTTRQLVEAAKATGVDHLVLLSSTGAGRPMGAYLKAKAKAEALITGAGIPYTVFRPSAFTGAEGRRVPGAITAVLNALHVGWRPIPVEALARALLQVGRARGPLGVVLEGSTLWDQVGKGP